MGMRPLDVQIFIPKSMDVARITQAEQQIGQMRQQEVAASALVHTEVSEQTVKKSEESLAKRVEERKERTPKKQDEKERENEKEEKSGKSSQGEFATSGKKLAHGLDILA